MIFKTRQTSLSLLTFLLAAAPLAALPQIDEQDRVRIQGNVHHALITANPIGRMEPSAPMERIILALKPSVQKQAALEALLARQQNPASSDYHRWLTPEAFGERFGAAQENVEAVTAWLQGHGFSIEETSPSRLSITFSGTADQVEQAFLTPMLEYRINGHLRHANAFDPSIPRALSNLVNGIVSLHNIPRASMNTGARKLSNAEAQAILDPQYTTTSGAHYLSPSDFATIYNLKPLYATGVDGTGTTIAVVGRTHPALSDITTFRSTFALPVNNPTYVINGTDPGDLGADEDGEADLDVEWSGAVAKNATVKFVISKSTSSTDGVDLSAQYIVNNNLAPVMTTSFGQCESSMGTTEVAFYNNLWSQAAAQGISSFVSSGDAGAAGCNGGSDSSGSGRAVSGLSSTPYNIAVGGTQFNEGSGTYWNTTTASDGSSVLSYIPEVVWNESANVSGGSGLWATGGGASSSFAKPSWQVALGVPSDGKRDVPDVSLTAAGHDGYLVRTQGSLAGIGGTSASSPSFAGIMALIVQKTGQRQGNANPTLYQLASAQFVGSGPAIFHDTTSGNNSVPGVTGYSAGVGYDLATGLGSVDANALVSNWSGTAPTNNVTATISAPTSGTTVASGATVTFTGSATDSSSAATLSYAWNFGDGSSATGASASHAYTNTGTSAATYTATFTATDNTGAVGSATTQVIVNPTPGAKQLLTNPGFESGSTGWTASAGVIGANGPSEPAHGGSYDAWLDGYGSTHTDTLYQQVAIPSTITTATLSFWLHIDTAETATTAKDTLTLQVRNSSGTVLATLGTWSNLNKASGYAQKTFNLSAYKGQTIRVYLVGTENSSKQTSFVVDDFALNVQ